MFGVIIKLLFREYLGLPHTLCSAACSGETPQKETASVCGNAALDRRILVSVFVDKKNLEAAAISGINIAYPTPNRIMKVIASNNFHPKVKLIEIRPILT